MPPFEAKVKPVGKYHVSANGNVTDSSPGQKRNTYYVNGIGAQTTEVKYIDPESESLSSQGTVVDNVDAAAPERCDDLEFHGSTNAFPAESSGKMMTIFTWTSLVCLDSLELVDVIPEPDRKSGLVEGLFMHNGYPVSVFVPLEYAEQRKHQCYTSFQSPASRDTHQGDGHRSLPSDPTSAGTRRRSSILTT